MCGEGEGWKGMSIGIQFKVDNRKSAAKLRAMREAASNTSTGPIRDGFDDSAQLYVAYVRRRFTRYSNHGGDWSELSDTTLAKRRSEGFRGSRILFVVGDLFNALQLGSALIMQRIAKGFRIRFSNTKQGKIASYQHSGTVTIPARPIIAPADNWTIVRMRNRVLRGFQQAMQDARERAAR